MHDFNPADKSLEDQSCLAGGAGHQQQQQNIIGQQEAADVTCADGKRKGDRDSESVPARIWMDAQLGMVVDFYSSNFGWQALAPRRSVGCQGIAEPVLSALSL